MGVTGTFLGTPSQGVWSTACLDFSVPPCGIAKLHFGAFGGSIPGLVQQSAGTLELYSMQHERCAGNGARGVHARREHVRAVTSLHSSWSQPTLPCAVSPSKRGRAREGQRVRQQATLSSTGAVSVAR